MKRVSNIVVSALLMQTCFTGSVLAMTPDEAAIRIQYFFRKYRMNTKVVPTSQVTRSPTGGLTSPRSPCDQHIAQDVPMDLQAIFPLLDTKGALEDHAQTGPVSAGSEEGGQQLEISILSAYKRYTERLRKSVTPPPGFVIPSAFTATKVIDGELRRVTYLPEIHFTTDVEIGAAGLSVAQELAKVRDTIFIEHAQASDVMPPSGPIFFADLVKKIQLIDEVHDRMHKEGSLLTKEYHGIIYSLPRASQYNALEGSKYVNLEPRATPYIREIRARIKELDLLRTKRGGGYQKDIDDEWGALIEKEKRYVTSVEGLRERDLMQATSLMEQAPIGQSWAIGGLAHAQGVKEVLRENGWTINELE